MIDCCDIGPFSWDRDGRMALIKCLNCNILYYIPQCCDDNKCGGQCD